MLRVRDIMTEDVLTVGAQTSLRDAAELFARHHVGGAPVVDGGALVGVVSMSDIIDFLTAPPNEALETPGDLVEDGGDAADETAARYFAALWDDIGVEVVEPLDDATGTAWNRLAAYTVAEVMTRVVVAVSSDMPVALAAARLRERDVHRALVVDSGSLRGILTTTDIARAVADERLTRRTLVFGPPRPSRLRR